MGQDQRVEVEVTAGALFGGIDLFQHQGAGIHAAPLGRPGAGRVIHRIARLGQDQAQGPAQWALSQALLQVVLQDLLCGVRDRVVVAVTFLAMLELMKRREIIVEQAEPWGAIVARATDALADDAPLDESLESFA